MLLLILASIACASDPELPPLEELLPDTFSESTTKKRLYDTVYEGHEVTFYCGCTYADKIPDLASCGLRETLTGARSERTEVEHVVAASAIGRGFPCWEEGGRSHCIKTDPVFKTAHNDLHNLFPVVGEVNGDRSNFDWGYIEGEATEYGPCDFEIDREANRAEPPPSVRGDIARVHFYMQWQYGISLSDGQRRLFLSWHAEDPVDEWEIERDKRIEAVQGNSNPFVR